tara:strand:+ start:718 stop:1011 length:294 start_codon:yes stop_codon:yes gene_type:complete
MRCLTDNEVACFIDHGKRERGTWKSIFNRVLLIEHLNSCVDCFEHITSVMNLIEENKELCNSIDQSYKKMISNNSLDNFEGDIKGNLAVMQEIIDAH